MSDWSPYITQALLLIVPAVIAYIYVKKVRASQAAQYLEMHKHKTVSDKKLSEKK